MNAKLLITLVVAANYYGSCGAALRRTPKVYNALITTDENLTSSRAYPIIQPAIHEPGVAHFPFGPYSPYGFYTPPVVRFGQPIAPGLQPREQLPFPLPQSQFPQQQQSYLAGFPFAHNPPATAPAALPVPPPHKQEQSDKQQQQPNSSSASNGQQEPVKSSTVPAPEGAPNYIPMPMSASSQPQAMPNEKLPIELNEFGLPPALIPFQQFPSRHEQPLPLPLPVPTYSYQQYPLIYDPLTGYPEHYLPPYGYFASHNFAFGSLAANGVKSAMAPATPAPHAPPATAAATTQTPPGMEGDVLSTETDDNPALAPTTPDIESIKNVSKNKNHAVPDVPPPPIPSGAKAKQ